MTISKEERAELRELTKAANGEWRVLSPGELVFANDVTNWVGSTERQEDTALVIAAVNAMPVLLDALDAADERIAGLEAEVAEADRRFASSVAKVVREYVNKEATLQKRIAELEAAAQWRPIEEAPRDGTWLICRSNYSGDVWSVRWDDENNGGDGYWVRPDGTWNTPKDATHWRWLPIPALPEGGV